MHRFCNDIDKFGVRSRTVHRRNVQACVRWGCQLRVQAMASASATLMPSTPADKMPPA